MFFLSYLGLVLLYGAIFFAYLMLPTAELFDFSQVSDWFVAFFFFPLRFFLIFLALSFAYSWLWYQLRYLGRIIRTGWTQGDFPWSVLSLLFLYLIGFYEALYFFPILTWGVCFFSLIIVVIEGLYTRVRRRRLLRELASLHQQNNDGAPERMLAYRQEEE